MKKFILFFNLLLLFFTFGITANAATWRFKWTDTTIHIPVGDELGRYIEMPKARLYKDDKLLADAKIDYAREGDWLYFLKDVNTNKCGEYRAYYKASETEKYKPGTCHGYKQIITFIVEDKIKPRLTIKSSELYKKRATADFKAEDLEKLLKNNVVAKDNYSECDISFVHSIDITKIDRYRVMAYATDSEGNLAEGEFYFNVIEGSKPTITYLGDGDSLTLPLGSSYNVKELFKAFDEVDGDITDKIKIPKIKTDSVSSEVYNIVVFNKIDQEATFRLTINIVDDEKPEIILNQNSIFIDLDTNIEEYDFLQYVDEITDNAEINMDNLTIKHNILPQVGKYIVTYSYTDGVNTVEELLDVTIKATTKPKIKVDDIKITTGDKIDLKMFITVEDETDPLAIENLEIDESRVDYKKAGSYLATAYCSNSSGESDTVTFRVIVEDPKGEGFLKDKSSYLIIIMLVIILGLVGFIIYYFVIRKKRNTL